MSWLVANGVKGIGEEDSRVALVIDENGDRGLVCQEYIFEGETVLQVPLRLALTDHPDDKESNALLYPGAPWSVRLACKLLRHRAAGDKSPWAPYLRVLPSSVPAPLETFSWEDISSLRYPPMEEALHAADWLRADALQAASEEARGGLGEAEFRWALSVVHSRTFANAARSGGVGVRMLVPLVDMLNHGGDQANAGVGLHRMRMGNDNVRWDLVPPGGRGSIGGGWTMLVNATAMIFPGQELFLSYGERANDDFFLHYGFVPVANPHDEAVLWPDLEAALDWHYEKIGALTLSAEAAEPLYQAALDAGRQQLQLRLLQKVQDFERTGAFEDVQSAPAPPEPVELPAEVVRQWKQIKVVPGGRVSEEVIRAFAAVSGGDEAAAERAVVLRSAELLSSMAGPLPATGQLGGGGVSGGDGEDGSEDGLGDTAGRDAGSRGLVAGGLLTGLAVLLVDLEPQVLGDAEADPSEGTKAAAAAAAQGEEDGSEEDEARCYWGAVLPEYWEALVPRFTPILPEHEAAAAAAIAAATVAPPTTAARARVFGGIKTKYGVPPPGPGSKTSDGANNGGAKAANSKPPALATLARALLSVVAGGESGVQLSGPQRLAVQYRCYKQMVLWDVLLKSSISVSELAAFIRR